MTVGRLLRVWLGLGIQSFGGGVATLTLIRRAAIEQQGWLSEEEFTQYWALVQAAPGINLVALTILLGRRAAGLPGIAIALFGLLLPSAALTALLTAGYARIQHFPQVQAALRGVIPATVGLGLLTSLQMLRPPLIASRREGKFSLLLAIVLLFGSGGAVVYLRWPVVLVLAGAGGLNGLYCLWRSLHSAEKGRPK